MGSAAVSLRTRSQHPLDVFCEHVELKIHTVAVLARVEVCERVGVRDDPASEAALADFGDGETDAIDSDASFINHVLRELGRQRDFQSVIGSVGCVADERCGRIDVALHEMPAHFCASTERGFEVHFSARRDVADAGAAESFGEQIKRDAVARDLRGSEAAAVHRDAVADDRAGRNHGRTEREPCAFFAWF